MSDVLARICDGKRALVEARRAVRPQAEIERAAGAAPPARGFAAALTRAVEAGGYGLIAEIKKASPSAGLIRPDFDPAQLAGAYARGGAACLSVLTDAEWFQGDDAYLAQARAAVPLPCLRKDFLVDPWQVWESRALGADCILLILAALDDHQAADFEALALGLGMDVLIEVHDRAEFERALALRSPLIGVNNRDLKTMVTDIAATETLAALLPAGRVLVSESGLKTPADLARMARAGARRFLIGEALMRQPDVEAATRTLLGGNQLTHIDAHGNALMVDVTAKDVTERVAVAKGSVLMAPATLALIMGGGVKKGDVLPVAQLAGIMGAKRTPDLIPLCHPLALTAVTVELACDPARHAVDITATCKLAGRTGVEMEALTAVSVAALTIYDMCKAVDKGMRLTDIRLVRKSGGKSGLYEAP